ncbi:uncharacterized protein B0I36DRAFT_405694 [Microdochium trichocladiopsis]|uniref:F-box domain-containing protein n=1 Tax=Microdochium trichocladiopsis TaxID=1682393 RepID=A0A9P8YC31_9PEZI|nr:uncharacterized protein B0I36DRAFT_405694 [Microdochium trichocladiopsis]KAH7035150.1 hypothetical protein B0I36DRAFT_405694 [Microdochium trichocladiopsis]
MAVIQDLPNELLDMIVAAAGGKTSDLISLCLVSKRFDAITRPHLWHTIELSPHTKPWQLTVTNSIARNPTLALLVRQLTIPQARSPGPSGPAQDNFPGATIDQDQLLSWVSNAYDSKFVEWLCAKADQPWTSISHIATFLVLHMRNLEILTYATSCAKDGDSMIEMFKQCEEICVANRGELARMGGNTRLPLANLHFLDLSNGEEDKPLYFSTIHLPRLNRFNVYMPRLDLLKVPGRHTCTIQRVVIRDNRFHESYIRKLLVSMPALRALRYISSEFRQLGNSAVQPDMDALGTTLRQHGQNLAFLDFFIIPDLIIHEYDDGQYETEVTGIRGRIGSLKQMTALRFLRIGMQHLLGLHQGWASNLADVLPPSLELLILRTMESLKSRLETHSRLVADFLRHHSGFPRLWSSIVQGHVQSWVRHEKWRKVDYTRQGCQGTIFYLQIFDHGRLPEDNHLFLRLLKGSELSSSLEACQEEQSSTNAT